MFLRVCRIRLQEGFYFAHYSPGICSMVLEVQMKVGIGEKIILKCYRIYIDLFCVPRECGKTMKKKQKL